MKKILWIIAGIVVFGVVCFLLGHYTRDNIVPGGTIVTNNQQGNHPAFTNFVNVTNNFTNLVTVYKDYLHYKTDPFIFIQKDDTMTASLYDRTASSKIKDWTTHDGPVFGGGARFSPGKIAPGISGGYWWDRLTIYGTATIATNWDVFAGGLWRF